MGWSTLKLAASVGVGLIAAVIAWLLADPLVGVMAGWMATGLAFCAITWVIALRMTPEQTRNHAIAEDPGRILSSVVLLLASVGSLLGVGALLVAGSTHGRGVQAETILGVGVVAVSWVTVHSVFALHYARVHYTWDGTGPGIDFNTPEDPDYHDFAYLSFTIGMCYQVSDTILHARASRRLALQHSFLAYLLGAVVIACSVNLVLQIASAT